MDFPAAHNGELLIQESLQQQNNIVSCKFTRSFLLVLRRRRPYALTYLEKQYQVPPVLNGERLSVDVGLLKPEVMLSFYFWSELVHIVLQNCHCFIMLSFFKFSV